MGTIYNKRIYKIYGTSRISLILLLYTVLTFGIWVTSQTIYVKHDLDYNDSKIFKIINIVKNDQRDKKHKFMVDYCNQCDNRFLTIHDNSNTKTNRVKTNIKFRLII